MVVDLIGEVTEIAVLAVFLLVPIVGELDQPGAPRPLDCFSRPSSSAAHKKTPGVNFALSLSTRPHFLQSQRVLIEF